MLFVLHRVGDSLVAEPVFKIVLGQQSNGVMDMHVEVESEEEVSKDTILAFMSENEAAKKFNEAVDPMVALEMVAHLAQKSDKVSVDLKAEAENLEQELDEVILQLKKYFHMEE